MNEAPYLKTCRFCENPRCSPGDLGPNGRQPWDILRLVCLEHWDQFWAERDATRGEPLAGVDHHCKCWADQIYMVWIQGEGKRLYSGRFRRRAAKARVEKALRAGKQVRLFYADVIWEPGLAQDLALPVGELPELEAVE